MNTNSVTVRAITNDEYTDSGFDLYWEGKIQIQSIYSMVKSLLLILFSSIESSFNFFIFYFSVLALYHCHVVYVPFATYIYFYMVLVEMQVCRNTTNASTGDLTYYFQNFSHCEWKITISAEFHILLNFEHSGASPYDDFYGLQVSTV